LDRTLANNNNNKDTQNGRGLRKIHKGPPGGNKAVSRQGQRQRGEQGEEGHDQQNGQSEQGGREQPKTNDDSKYWR
jgi:hypothetical protein